MPRLNCRTSSTAETILVDCCTLSRDTALFFSFRVLPRELRLVEAFPVDDRAFELLPHHEPEKAEADGDESQNNTDTANVSK